MSDRIFFPSAALAVLAMISLAMVWPQGYGARSLGPFGRIPVLQTPAMQAALAREAAGNQRRPLNIASPAAAAGLRPHQ
jgi:hypothetical protein